MDHIAAQKEAKVFSKILKINDFLIDLYYHFDKTSNRKGQLKEFMVFNNTEVRKVCFGGVIFYSLYG